ncbi:MAG: M20/M25/M40 family metallo-hydrolase [Acidimicrobiia bacterium]|nr:M20/M25/M40 family metallo-hydrolase [Acidimicrobiia bacterium]
MTVPGDEVVELLVALVRNACVNDGTPDAGQERRSVETIADYLGARGREFEPHPGRVSTLYRVEGTDPEAPSLMLMGHTDVVPVSPDGWSVDPFEGIRSDGFVWGRGTVDMLNQTAAMAAVFKRYLDGEVAPPAGDLLFFAVADEEASGTFGAHWIVEHHWEEVACDYLLTEIGAPALTGGAGPGIPVTVAEKGPHWRRLRASGTPGHGSQPYRADNALLPLARAITRLDEHQPPVAITDVWRRFVAAWGPPRALAEALVDPDRVDAAIDELALDDPGFARWVHACTHMTISPNTLEAGVKANVVPDRAVAELDVRTVPGQDADSVHDHFRKAIGPGFDDDLDLDPIESTPASESPTDGPLWEAMETAIDRVAPGARLLPTLIPVATDARFFRPRGTVCYGLGLHDDRLGFGEFLSMFHGHDERVSERSVGLTARLYAAIVDDFSRSAG